MQIQSLITPSRTLCGLEASSKKRALELLANAIAQDLPDIDADDLFLRLVARERLGSTGIGFGVGIPHCRASHCESAIGALVTLAQPIDFDAIDGEKVDIIFAMLVPEDAQQEHLQALATLAAALNDENYRHRLRAASDDNALYQAAIT